MRGSFRNGFLLAMVWMLWISVQAHAAGTSPELEVRVLLLETPGPLWLEGSRVESGSAGLRVDGIARGEAWWSDTEGPHRLGDRVVEGRVGVLRSEEGLRVLNHVPLESYVLGTLAGEVFDHWEPEMLKAQAVAVRSFALYRRRQRSGQVYDVSAGTADQVYVGASAASRPLEEAVRATQGQVLVHAGAPILAAFHSASGGRTASAEEVWGRALPYLVSRDVLDEEESPDTYWRARLSGPTLVEALRSLGLDTGEIREVRVAGRTDSGRATGIWFGGERGGGTVGARALRRRLGEALLRSTLFEVFRSGGDVVFVGSGHGHGVGMSQWGGQAMASRGASYREILGVFYPGTELVEEVPR